MQPDIRAAKGVFPRISPKAYVDPKATVIGDVEIGNYSSVWPGAVIRGDLGPIRIGKCTNVQENVVIHTEAGIEVKIGDYVTICHGSIIHACQIDDYVLISQGVIVMNKARVRSYSIVDAGALVVEGHEIPSGVVVHGSPGKPFRQATEEEKKYIEECAKLYADIVKRYLRTGSL